MTDDPLVPPVGPWRVENGVLKLAIRLTPRGGRDALEGVELRDDGKPVLKARVRAVPEDGAANAALVKLLAKQLGVPASAVSLTAGHTARVKMLAIHADAAALQAALRVLTGL